MGSLKDEYQLKLTYYDDSGDYGSGGKIRQCSGMLRRLSGNGYGASQNNGMKLLVEEKMSLQHLTPFAVLCWENADLLEKFNAGLKNIKENGTYDES